MDSLFQRRPTTQDISWFLDLQRNGQLDLDPPYQRRSVWTRKDRQFFLDTIFRGYPSPAIFLHKTIAEDGKTSYHVVDGKQRLETILAFADDRIRLSSAYGDARLDGKKWSQLDGDPTLRQSFWDYQLTVEMVNFRETTIINEVFARLNRNSRKLMPQELRHARFDGWLVRLVESEAKRPEWETLGIATAAREKRMADSQAISELIFVLLEGEIHGFDQNMLDELYAKYDDVAADSEEPESLGVFQSEEQFSTTLEATKTYILEMDKANGSVSTFAKTIGNFYTLWSFVALEATRRPDPRTAADRYKRFMEEVARQRTAQEHAGGQPAKASAHAAHALIYASNLRGASTDLAPRRERLKALSAALLQA